MNAGAAAANGDVLLFLHADTRLPDDALTAIIDAIGAGAAWGRFDVRIEGQHPLLGLIARMMNLRSRLTGIATGDQAIFCSRALFDALGGYAPIALMEDIDFSRRARARFAPTCLRARVTTSGRRWEKHGVLRTVLLMWRLRCAIFSAPIRRISRLPTVRIMNEPGTAVLVFARAPVPGAAKTRLAPLLGDAGAADASARLTLRALRSRAGSGYRPGRAVVRTRLHAPVLHRLSRTLCRRAACAIRLRHRRTHGSGLRRCARTPRAASC
jgi:hypothetical protein